MSKGDLEQIRAAQVTSTGTLVASQAGRLRGGFVRAAGTAGTAVFKDGGSGGATILTVNTPAAVGVVPLDIPGSGIPFATDLHVTLTTADACTVFYAEDNG